MGVGMSLFAELKRRNVFRVAVAYVVLSWLLLQVGDVLFETLELPSSWNKGLLAIVALGLGPVLIFSWIYEMTPEGVKRESQIEAGESITAHTAKKLDVAVIILLTLAIGLFALERFSPGSPATPASVSPSGSTATVQTEPGATNEDASSQLARGVAVLPFENLSDNASNAFFAGGVHEDVLTNLSRIPDLRVISRTSMMRISEAGLDIKGIASRLGVSHVLEGTVRRAEDRVRVTVQLIDGSNDEHLWAQNYDRTLTDIFAIQSEIALAISEQLKAELSPETVKQLMDVPTGNARAYDLLLEARVLRRNAEGTAAERFGEMIALTQQALDLDPEFLEAKILLAFAHGRMVWSREDPDGDHARAALDIVEEVQSRWPLRPEAGIARGDYLYTVAEDFDRAYKAYASVQLQRPNDLHVLAQMSYALKRLGRFDEFQLYGQRVLELDPESAVAARELSWALILQGKDEEALAQDDRSLARFPDNANVEQNWAENRLNLLGDRSAVLEVAKRQGEKHDAVYFGGYRTWWLVGDGKFDAAIQLIEDRKEKASHWYQSMVADVELSHILNLQGRDADAQVAATRAFELILANEPEGGYRQKGEWADVSYVAAVAGDTDQYRLYREQWAQAKPVDLFDESAGAMTIALADALMGDPSEAWKLLQPWQDKPGLNTPTGVASFRNFFDIHFGEVPEYQEYLARARVIQ
jgi:TolB-like protein